MSSRWPRCYWLTRIPPKITHLEFLSFHEGIKWTFFYRFKQPANQIELGRKSLCKGYSRIIMAMLMICESFLKYGELSLVPLVAQSSAVFQGSKGRFHTLSKINILKTDIYCICPWKVALAKFIGTQKTLWLLRSSFIRTLSRTGFRLAGKDFSLFIEYFFSLLIIWHLNQFSL